MEGGEKLIKAVIFDLDNTLYDYNANDVIAMRALCSFARENLDLDEESFRKVYAEARKIIKKRLTEGAGQHNRMLFFQAALELIGKNPFHYATEMYETYWGTFLKNMSLYDGALEFLQSLKAENLKIAICTDMTAHIQYRKIKRLGLSDLIDAIVTSEEVGFEKPSPLIFERVLEKLTVEANEAAYFGDSFRKDIEGSANCGMKPFYFVADREVDEKAFAYTKIKSYKDLDLRSLFK